MYPVSLIIDLIKKTLGKKNIEVEIIFSTNMSIGLLLAGPLKFCCLSQLLHFSPTHTLLFLFFLIQIDKTRFSKYFKMKSILIHIYRILSIGIYVVGLSRWAFDWSRTVSSKTFHVFISQKVFQISGRHLVITSNHKVK